MPFWPGPEPQLNKILQVLNMEYISSCQKLWQGAGKSDSIPYIWVDFNTSLFNIDESRPFKVMVKGYNIQCNSTTGQQIIMVQSNLDISNSDISNSAKLKASI